METQVSLLKQSPILCSHNAQQCEIIVHDQPPVPSKGCYLSLTEPKTTQFIYVFIKKQKFWSFDRIYYMNRIFLLFFWGQVFFVGLVFVWVFCYKGFVKSYFALHGTRCTYYQIYLAIQQ